MGKEMKNVTRHVDRIDILSKIWNLSPFIIGFIIRGFSIRCQMTERIFRE
jgi:hypothetical protein